MSADNWTGRVWSTRRFGVTWWHWQVTGFRSANWPPPGRPKPTRNLMAQPAETGCSFIPRLSREKALARLRKCGEAHVRSATRYDEEVV